MIRLTFGSAEESGSAPTPAQLNGLGSLVISINRLRRTRPRMKEPRYYNENLKVKEVPEKVLKGKAVTNSVMHAKLLPISL